MKAILIVEAFSTGMFYLQDILDRGFLPLVIYPRQSACGALSEEYERSRAACQKKLPPQAVLIPDDGDFSHLLQALSSYDILCVVAGSELGVTLADRLVEALELPGNPPQASALHLNKDLMQQALCQKGLKSIRGRLIHTPKEALAFWDELDTGQVVLKPVSGAGTMGLHFCASPEETVKAAAQELEGVDLFGKPNREYGLIMQERIIGTEYIVNTVSRNGIHRVTDIWVYDKVARGSQGNAYNYARILNRLEGGHGELVEYAYKVLDALSIRYGPTHGEYMMTDQGPVLIELGARPMGGSFPKDLLDQLLGHHLTDVSLDSYLDGEAFENARMTPYRPKGFLINKFFITPRGGSVDSFPVLTVLRSLKTMVSANLSQAFTSQQLPTTVDLETAPGNILLYSQDESQVWKDYRILRTIEEECFSALFQIDAPSEAYPPFPPQIPALDGSMGKIRILADKKLSCPPSAQEPCQEAECLAPDEMRENLPFAHTAIFLMQAQYSLEERVSLLFSLIRSVKPGGRILIPESIYGPMSIGRKGLERLLAAFGVILEIPLYQKSPCILGTVSDK